MKNSKKTIIVATTKKWNINNAMKLNGLYSTKYEILILTNPEELKFQKISRINPLYIFFPHWSWIISREICEKFNCIIFHMTDLPFGRGGSPLQNLILRGYSNTKISAIKATKQIDSGDILLKESLSLKGNAQKIYERCSKVIFSIMIPKILNSNIVPKKQTGKITKFKRRLPKQSKIPNAANINKAYDYIRMLDAEGYPKAFMNTDLLKYEFYDAKIINGKINAKVIITNQNENTNDSGSS